ncbi:putative monovalent cation/H+ antiporter subunit A [Roseiflexus sp.]|uniref:putative monovalent cation/H+ antiporter subunit A n=1 Tax=Roseiflexus sp. TaxID=2562120 RepID=UPI0021DC7A51|nr:putative monovalent cation/H+ antiporter subunit A [Roseiflexus sp.]GIW00756.1 MAG: Na(+)/H(+) antiporter subunit A [Roseiflexus sp.]
MLTAVLSGFGGAIAAPWLHRVAPRSAGWIVALLPFALMIYFISLVPTVAGGETLRFSYAWVPSLGINLSFRIDGLSLLFALLITGIGTLVMIYAGGYLANDPMLGRMLTLLLIFMAAMLGIVTSDNLIGLFVFWELTTISSYLLIGYKHEYEKARKAALQSLLVTGIGGLALLAGFVLLGQVAGTLEISDVLTQGAAVRAHPLYGGILALVLFGAFTKSAQFPFHFWLPGAMEAPTPVSSYLHSATMVKAGVFLLARLNPVLGGTEAWQWLLTGFGSATMIVGALLAVQQTDLKRILAYTTVSALGTLVALIGVGTDDALKAAMVFTLSHALYKGALFQVAGSVDHETGTRDITNLGGLRAVMPITAAAGMLAAVSMAGLPPLFGFIAKEVQYKANLEEPILITVALLTNMLTVVAAGLVSLRVFFGPPTQTPKHAHEAPLSMRMGPVVLALTGLGTGLFSVQIGNALIGPATGSVIGKTKEIELLLWAGIEGAAGQALVLSVVTLVVGAGLYRARGIFARFAAATAPLAPWGAEGWYQRAVDGMLALAAWQTRLLQNGYLRFYIGLIIATVLALTTFTLVVGRVVITIPADWADVRVYELMVALIIIAATTFVIRATSRMAAVVGLGFVGYGTALVFLLFSGPDLAITQFAVETLVAILFVLVVYRLPRFSNLSTAGARVRSAGLAIAGGAMMTVLTLMALASPTESRVSGFLAENSVPQAFGRNVVNVILVDFRGFDTMGEITVLGAAAVGIYALLRLVPASEHDEQKGADAQTGNGVPRERTETIDV